MSNLWILTEERPKTDVLQTIIARFLNDRKVGFFANPLRIVPVLDNNQTFTFCYQVLGINTPYIDNIYIKTVSGYSSFVDFLVYFQENKPKSNDVPIYAIEETKTDDSESRNAVYQRCSKFIYIDYFYSNVKKLMLYSLRIQQKEKPTKTNLFGSRLLATLGVEIIGKTLNDEQIKPFNSIDELIEQKNKMRKASKGNVPILITKHSDKIEISGKLFKSNKKSKSGGLSHDPNIGALSIISAVLRKLGWQKQIVITMHGLEQSHLTPKNKFIKISNLLSIQLDNLQVPMTTIPLNYWKYDNSGEKLATIFIHLVVESFTKGYAIFENHAGCERSYFQNAQKDYISLPKQKQGNKGESFPIPDLILIDMERLQILNIEGKTYQNRLNGIDKLNNYNLIENKYIKPNYPSYKIMRTVVIYGSQNNEIAEIEIGFMLNENGKMILGIQAPPLFTQAIHNLLDYWKI